MKLSDRGSNLTAGHLQTTSSKFNIVYRLCSGSGQLSFLDQGIEK